MIAMVFAATSSGFLFAPIRTAADDSKPTSQDSSNLSSTPAKPSSVLSKFQTGELDDVNLREFLKAKLALAEKHGTKSKQEMDEYRKAIAELNDRIAKGPSDSERFESKLKPLLALKREQGERHATPNQPKWTFEMRALLEALHDRNPAGKLFCDIDFALSQEHSALVFGGVRIEVLLPFAKREVSQSPIASDQHEMYLRGLIQCATERDEDSTEAWLRYFELHKMSSEKSRFPTEVAQLKLALK